MKAPAIRLFALITSVLFIAITQAQTSIPADPALQALYGDMAHGESKPLNPLANIGLILPDTKAEEWPAIREKILKRVNTAFGNGPVALKPAVNKFEEIERYQNYGLTHIKYRYQVVDEIWSEAILVLPEKFQQDGKSVAILTIHGTNGKAGKQGAIGAPGTNRAYGTELAKKGYITFSPDLFGYGSTINGTTEEKLVADLLKKYPEWSYRGIKLLTLIRAIDVLEQLPFVKKGAYGSMGNSLGGGMGLFHAAIDPRIKASVPSTGVSPAATNIFRLLRGGMNEEPTKWKKIQADGKPPYDVQEIIALCAPRPMLFLDDFNDPYNPDVAASFRAIYQAMQVYQLLGTPGHISVLIHGDGHDTIDDVREYAYKWFDRYLLKDSK
ncbi:MAG: dienelactone hydrolase family protein [Ferruginibacter sp.]|nr:dienelactone hydrolase family protein [Ferruginibacter sp.]